MKKNRKANKILALYVLWLLLVFLYPFHSESGIYQPENQVKCKNCQKTIHGRIIQVNKYNYHPECFICEKCGETLSGEFVKDGIKKYHPICYKMAKGLECAHCGKLLGDKWMVYENNKYHNNCMDDYIDTIRPHCNICGKIIDGQYTKDENGSYHTSCYKRKILPKCSVCISPIENKFFVDAWGNKTHENHGGKPVNYCSSCMRVVSDKTSNGMYEYSDGRIICGYCVLDAIDGPESISESMDKVIDILQTIGISDSHSNVPVHLVDKKYLKKKSKQKFNDKAKGFTHCKTTYLNGKTAFLKQDIYILSGLPELEFKGVLAHEILHTWLNKHQIKMSDNDIEGFCNLGTMRIYEEEGSEFAQVLLKSMEKDPDPGYGKAYRRMKIELEKIGWQSLIKRIKNK
ncbi:MAG: protein DA1 [Desulfobacteraceae bacterium]|jgi:hypothetical protein|nr:protein DA1 [Desulfobacteraceae bacterium]